MTTKQLLSSNSYIQYPKFLGFYIGVNEAVLLSALCDKDSWCEFNIENYDGWFYFLREEIYFETGLTERQQRSAILKLEDLNIVVTKRQGIPAKVYYYINTDALELVLNHAYESYKAHKSQMLQNVTSCPNKNVTTCTSENVISTIDNNINIKTNKSTLTGAPLKHPRNFSKEKLTDDLESGKDIDAQKKEKKKLSNFEKCLEEINSRHFTESEKELLKRHLEWSYNSKDAKRIKDRMSIKSKLDFLEQRKAKGDDLIKIIQQSIDRCWHAFYEYSDTSKSSTSKHECFADSVIVNEKSREEQLADLARNRELYGEY